MATIMIFLMLTRPLNTLPEKKDTTIMAAEIMVEFMENACRDMPRSSVTGLMNRPKQFMIRHSAKHMIIKQETTITQP